MATTTTKIDFSKIPDDLKQSPRWVLWQNDDGSKVPYQIDGKRARTNDDATLAPFDIVAQCFDQHPDRWQGVAYTFGPEDGFFGIDIDGCRDPETGTLKDWAASVIELCGTYCEVSPSGYGVKVIGRGVFNGKQPGRSGRTDRRDRDSFGDKQPEIAIYDERRFWTMTGRVLDGYKHIRNCQQALDDLTAQLWPPREQAQPQPATAGNGADVVERARRYVATMEPAIAGQGGHNQTYAVACKLVEGFALSPDDAWPILLEFNERCEPAWSEDELRHKLNDACHERANLGYLRDSDRGTGTSTIAKPKDSNGKTPAMLDPRTLTEMGFTDRIEKQIGERMRYVGRWDKWLYWDGKRWQVDDMRKVEQAAQYCAKRLWTEFAATAELANKEQIADAYRFTKSAQRKRFQFDCLQLLRSRVAVDYRVLDADPWVLNVENGTVDLKTGLLRPHRQADMLTKIANVEYDPNADCPTWRTFMDEIFEGDQELVRFVRRLAGYSLTGTTTEHLLAFLHGGGANGKSTLLEVLLALMGDYAMKAPTDILLARSGEAHPTERADLHGKRLVACVEADQNRRFNEPLLKELTGGDSIRARRMREDFWEFRPTHTIWLGANHKPTIRGTDDAVWSRIRLLPFNAQWDRDGSRPDLPPADPTLRERLLDERCGILQWCLVGLVEWQAEGMQTPQAVLDATKEYRSENDIFGAFVADVCVLGPRYVAGSSDLFKAYTDWCGTSYRPVNRNKFANELRRIGCEQTRLHGGRMAWEGIGLREQ